MSKRPRDPNQLAKFIVDIATGEKEDFEESKNKARQDGGKKGGKSRAEKLTPEERKKIAKNAAEARWSKD